MLLLTERELRLHSVFAMNTSCFMHATHNPASHVLRYFLEVVFGIGAVKTIGSAMPIAIRSYELRRDAMRLSILSSTSPDLSFQQPSRGFKMMVFSSHDERQSP
jgi:hypothetical protein